MKNIKKAEPEIVDLEKFAGLCVITTLGCGERCVMLLREQGLALARTRGMEQNYIFWGVLQALATNIDLSRFDTKSAIVTPMLKGEKPEDVALRLANELKKIQREKNSLFSFARLSIPTPDMFPDLINLQYTIGQVKNLPGGLRVPIGFKVEPGTPYFNLFLPRDEAGNFINLGAQKLCLHHLEVLPDLKDILANVITLKPGLIHNVLPIDLLQNNLTIY